MRKRPNAPLDPTPQSFSLQCLTTWSVTASSVTSSANSALSLLQGKPTRVASGCAPLLQGSGEGPHSRAGEPPHTLIWTGRGIRALCMTRGDESGRQIPLLSSKMGTVSLHAYLDDILHHQAASALLCEAGGVTVPLSLHLLHPTPALGFAEEVRPVRSVSAVFQGVRVEEKLIVFPKRVSCFLQRELWFGQMKI